MATAVAVAMVLSVLSVTPFSPFSPLEAAADEYSIFDLLGIDTGVTPDGYNEGDAYNPYGKDKVNINPVSELYMEQIFYNGGNHRQIFGVGTDLVGTGFSTSNTGLTGTTPAPGYDVGITAAGDFLGTGKKGQIMALGANVSGGLFMYAIDPTNGAVSTSDIISLIPATTRLGNSYEKDNYFNNARPCYAPQMLNNYLGIVAGDFTGDGVDEVAVYVPDAANPRVDVYQLQKMQNDANWWAKSKWHVIYSFALTSYLDSSNAKFAPNIVSLVAGDMNFDGVDDLAVGAGSCTYLVIETQRQSFDTTAEAQTTLEFRAGQDYSPEFYNQAKVTALLSSSDGGILPHHEVLTTNRSPYLGLAFGDADGDGRSELVVCSNTGLFGTQYNGSTNEFEKVYGDLNAQNINDTNKTPYLRIRPNAMVVRQGIGQAAYISWMGRVFRAADGNLTEEAMRGVPHSGLTWNNNLGFASYYGFITNPVASFSPDLNNRDYPDFAEFGQVASDLNGDGSDEIIVYYAKDEPSIVPIESITLDNGTPGGFLITDIEPNLTISHYYGATSNRGMRIYSGVSATQADLNSDYLAGDRNYLFAVPDVDDDTVVLDFKERRFTYSDPKLLAVLAAPPVFSELADMDGGDNYMGSETTFADTKGEGQAESTAATFSLGAYLSFDYDYKVGGVSAATFEFELEYKHSWTWESSTQDTVSYTYEYGTQGATDSVALYSIPTDFFVYEVTQPNENGETVKQEMTIVIPYSPVVKVISAEEYDEVAAAYSSYLPTVRGNLLTHTPGQPETYLASATGLIAPRIFDGSYAGVHFGSGSIKQAISVEREEEESTSNNDEISFKAGGGSAVTVGIVAGGGVERTDAKISISGHEFTGTMFNMPLEARDYGYNVSWKLLQYWHEMPDPSNKDKKLKVPVVTYMVKDVTRPPLPPENLDVDVENTTADTVRLTWAYPASAAVSGFTVYRQDKTPGAGGAFLAIGTVPYSGATEYSFDDTGLAAATEYTYKLQVKRPKIPQFSIMSEAVSAWTQAVVGVPTVTLDNYDVIAYPDRSVTVRSTLSNVAPGAGGTSYVWQKYTSGKWADLQGVNTKDLSISTPKPAVNGTYRLRVTQTVENQTVVAYSKELLVTYQKRNAALAFTATVESATRVNLSATLTNTAGNSIAVPSGNITFRVSYTTDTGVPFHDYEYTVPLSNGKAEWPLKSGGIYIVSAYYAGDSVFNAVESETLTRIASTVADYTFWYIDAPDEVTVDDPFVFRLMKVTKDGNAINITELKETANADGWRASPVAAAANDVKLISGGDVGRYGAKATEKRLAYGWIDTTQAITTNKITFEVYHNNVLEGPVTKTISVKPLNLTVIAPSRTVQNTDLTYVTSEDFVVNGIPIYTRENGQEIALNGSAYYVNRYVNVKYFNNAGGAASFNTSTVPGVYTVRAESKTDVPPAKDGYALTFVPGTYNVTGPTYAVTGSVAGTGGVMAQTDPVGNDDWSGRYSFGVGLTFQAAPDTGYVVDKWEFGNETIQGDALANRNTLTRSMPANDVAVKVYFREDPQPVSWRANGGGEVKLDGYAAVSSTSLREGTPLVFHATPASGKVFSEWIVKTGTDKYSYPEGSVDGNGNPVLKMNMPGEAIEVVAMFDVKQNPRVSWSAVGGTVGGGTVVLTDHPGVATALVAPETELTFTATPTAGNVFKEWRVTTGTGQYEYHEGTPTGGGRVQLAINMPDDTLEVVAVFEAVLYPVTVTSAGTGATGSGNYAIGDTAHISAGSPPTDQRFVRWSHTGDISVDATFFTHGSIFSSDATFVMIAEPVTVTAVFEDIPPTITSVTVIPAAVTIQKGESYSFSAVVLGERNPPQDVAWQVWPSDGDVNISLGTTIDQNGILTVAADEAAATMRVVAVPSGGVSFPSWGEALVTVADAPIARTVTGVTVTPDDATLDPGGTQRFFASVTGTNDPPQTVLWTLADNISAGTSISSAGLLTVGADETAETLSVTATSVFDPDYSYTVTVTVNPPPPVVKTVSVGAQTGALIAGTAGSASYTVTTSNIAVGAAIGLNTNGAEGVSLDAGTVATTGGSTTITIHTTDQTPAGAHPLTLTIDGVTSEPFDLVVGSVPDTDKPTVTDVTPSGADAALSGFIVIFFSEEMDPQTAGTVSIDGGEGVLAGGEWANAGEYRILYIGFAPGTAYRVTISGFKDISGNAMDDDGDWQFTTRVEAPTDILVAGIEITGPSSIGTNGGTAQLTALVTPAAVTNQALLWAVSSGGEYATLSLAGLVTAKGNGTVTVRAMALDGSGVYSEHVLAVSGQKEDAATNTVTNTVTDTVTVTSQGGPTNNTYNSYGLTEEQVKAIVGEAGSGGNAGTAAASAPSTSSAPSNEELFSIIAAIQAKMDGQPVQAGLYNLSEEDAAKLTAWLNGDQTPQAAPAAKNTASGIPWWVILLAALILAAGGAATALILKSGRRNRERGERG
ncbi:MAG: Ig-like domain-containing protein [Oscillospiraceae bacterium]|nr:Ig-like domain-containing protein [Oscillospiraceae bacterium]